MVTSRHREITVILGLLTNWRVHFFVGLLVLVAAGGFLPQTGNLLLTRWWFEHQSGKAASWRVVHRIVPVPKWWVRARQVYRWVRVGMWLGLCLWFLGHLLTPPAPIWARLCLLIVSHVTTRGIRCLLSDWVNVKPAPTQPTESQEMSVEVTIDLEPLLTELGDLSPTSGESTTLSRKALTARIESIRAECFQHPVSHALMEQLESKVQGVIARVVNEALTKEQDEYLGFGRYERTGEAKPPSQHRSGFFSRSLRTVCVASRMILI